MNELILGWSDQAGYSYSLTGDSKTPVIVSVSNCLSICISPVMDWQPVQSVSRQCQLGST